MKFNDEQLRVSVNLRQYYDAWIAAEREMRSLAYRLDWKTRGEKDYLYKIVDRAGNGTSLGPRSAKTEALFEHFLLQKTAAKERLVFSHASLDTTCRLYRALRLGSISSPAAAILREADAREMLGASLLVVGTNAMAAYEIEAASRFALGMDATEDFDLAWSDGKATFNLGNLVGNSDSNSVGAQLLGLLKAVDATYTVNQERPFQARNKNAYEVEILLAPSQLKNFPNNEPMRPIALPEQEWLLQGTPVDQVVCGRDATPARIVAPDPRWFALHKLWLADQSKRVATKRPKDKKQGEALLSIISMEMPQYPLDEAFEALLPEELKPYFLRWKDSAVPHSSPTRRW